MHPYLIQWGPISLSSYGAAMAVAFLVVIALASRAAMRLYGLVPMPPEAIADWACWGITGGILGGRLAYVALNWRAYLREPLEIFAIWHGGLVWYGGFLGGIIATLLYLRRHRYSLLGGLDQVIPFVTLGHAIGRIGCFLNGCCYGKPSTAWCAVQFPELPSPVVPTQLFEAAGLVALFVVLSRLQRASILSRPGLLFGIYLMSYALLRWSVEFWRDNPAVWDGLTIYQLISIAVFVCGAALVATKLRRADFRPSPRPAR